MTKFWKSVTQPYFSCSSSVKLFNVSFHFLKVLESAFYRDCSPLVIVNSRKDRFAVLSMNLAFANSLFGKEIWATLVISTFCIGLVYCYECTGSDLSVIRPSLIRRIIFETWTIQGLMFTLTTFPVFKGVLVVF